MIFKRKKEETIAQELAHGVIRCNADYTQGLTNTQVEERIAANLHNEIPESLTRTVPQIIIRNVFTLFNMLNVALAIVIVSVGHINNILFLGVALANTVIGIVQELRSKKTLDELSIVARTKVMVVREGAKSYVNQEDMVLDDIVYLSAGNQICADGDVLHSEGMEVDESLLTGESDHIQVLLGSGVMSGSFVTAGVGYIRVTAVGNNGYAAKISAEAKKEKKQKSEMIRTLNMIIRVLTIVIIPVGGLLFYSQYQQGVPLDRAILGSSAAILGMIPEGLMLLTGVTLAVAAINLAKHKALVQSLPSIETLARVDVLCLDKTGTITDGSLKLIESIPLQIFTDEKIARVSSELMGALKDENPTAKALRSRYAMASTWVSTHSVPFSSKRKWSGATFAGQGSYLIGAPSFIFATIPVPLQNTINKYAEDGHRVLCLAHSPHALDTTDVPADLSWCGLLIFSDNIRPEAPDTFRYFADEGVIIKVISGDDAVTVSTIARRAQLSGGDQFIDMSTVADGTDLTTIVEENTVFGRVTPYQKRELIRALQKNGHTTCMTGDGVNDVLALKESDCGVAMVGGSDAARSVADFVLLTSNFGAMVEVLKEGRRVINNIEQVASLYLVKTIYSILLSIIYIFLPYPYPFAPLQLSPVNSLTVGIPSFILALRPNYHRPEGKFVSNTLEHSLPAALTIVGSILVIQLAGVAFSLTQSEISTMNVLLTGIIGFVLLFKITDPPTKKIIALYILLITAFLTIFFHPFLRQFFMLDSLFTRNAFFYLPLAIGTPRIFYWLNRLIIAIEDFFARLGDKFHDHLHEKISRR